MHFTSAEAKARYDAIGARLAETVVGLDFDGVLAPIVDDPAAATIHPDAASVLIGLAVRVRRVAIITGRPARQAVALGGLDEIADAIAESGRELHVYGQYGNEHWSSAGRRIISPRPPTGLSSFERELPRLLREAGAGAATLEDKGLAVAVHTRQLPDPAGTTQLLLPTLAKAAERHGLAVEPGRAVIEVRASGMDKGQVVHRLVDDLGAGGFVFAGDDLGDVAAFEAVAELRDEGLATLLVYSESDEQSALRPLADVVVPGPDGVLALLRDLGSAG